MTIAAPTMSFSQRVDAAAERAASLVCVGLDPDFSRFPVHLRELGVKRAIVEFNRAIIESTSDLVCAFKPNIAFYLAYGVKGIEALIETRSMIPADIPVILDCKSGDVGSTAAAYAKGYFDEWHFDAVTVNPFLGEDSLAPFLAYPDRGVIILCKTSNPGSGEWQDLTVGEQRGEPLFLKLASRIERWSRRLSGERGHGGGSHLPRATRPSPPTLSETDNPPARGRRTSGRSGGKCAERHRCRRWRSDRDVVARDHLRGQRI